MFAGGALPRVMLQMLNSNYDKNNIKRTTLEHKFDCYKIVCINIDVFCRIASEVLRYNDGAFFYFIFIFLSLSLLKMCVGSTLKIYFLFPSL